MDLNYFVTPASKKSHGTPYDRLVKTVIKETPLCEVSKYTDLNLPKPIRVWGLRKGNKSYFHKMKRGDCILFYTGDVYEYSARIWITEYNEELAKQLWGVIEASLSDRWGGDIEPWPYIVYLQNLRKLSLRSAYLHNLLDWSEDHLNSTRRIKPSTMHEINQEYGSMPELIIEHTEEKCYDSDFPV